MYNPTHVLKVFRKDSTELTRDYLHTLLHCVFRHPYVASWVQTQYWNLACDIAVENVISSLGVRDFSCAREYGQKPFVAELHRVLQNLTAEEIYEHLVRNCISGRRLKELVKHFATDDHTIWYQRDDPEKEQESANLEELPDITFGKGVGNDGSSTGSSMGSNEADANGGKDSFDTENTGESKDAPFEIGKKVKPSAAKAKVTLFSANASKKARQEKLWERIATQIIMELEGEEGTKYIDEYSDGNTERGRKLREAICEKLHFASLEFQSIDGIVEAIGLPECELCTYCWNGKE